MGLIGSATSWTATSPTRRPSATRWRGVWRRQAPATSSRRRSGRPAPPTAVSRIGDGAGSVPAVGGGVVYLVGAGPGDPGLMTRRSLELIATADVILYDRLIPPSALDGARPDAELRYVGKEPGSAALSQGETNELLVELGR